MRAQESQLLGRFHPLGQHLQTQIARQGNDRGGDFHIAGIMRNIMDKALVDLELVDRKALQVRQ